MKKPTQAFYCCLITFWFVFVLIIDLIHFLMILFIVDLILFFYLMVDLNRSTISRILSELGKKATKKTQLDRLHLQIKQSR